MNSCKGSGVKANVDVRQLFTPGYVDTFGVRYDQRQFFFASRDIEQGEPLEYDYVYTDGAGGWYQGIDGVTNDLEALHALRSQATIFPCKTTEHAPVSTQQASLSRATPCPYCQPPACARSADTAQT